MRRRHVYSEEETRKLEMAYGKAARCSSFEMPPCQGLSPFRDAGKLTSGEKYGSVCKSLADELLMNFEQVK